MDELFARFRNLLLGDGNDPPTGDRDQDRPGEGTARSPPRRGRGRRGGGRDRHREYSATGAVGYRHGVGFCAEGRREAGEVSVDQFLHSRDSDPFSVSAPRRGRREYSPTVAVGYDQHSSGLRAGGSGEVSVDQFLHSRDSDPFSQRGGSAQRRGRGRSAQRRGRGRSRQGDGGRDRSCAFENDDLNSHREDGGHSIGNRRGRSQSRPQHNRNPGRTKYMTQDEINRLARSDSEELIQYITENEGGFLAAYRHQRYCSHPITLKHLIKFLYLLVMSDDNDLAARIVAHIFDDSGGSSRDTGTSEFRSSLESLIRKMPTETRQFVMSENPQYLTYLIEIGTFAISAVPLSVMYTFPYLSINDTVQRLPVHVVGGTTVQLLLPKAQALSEKFINAPTQVMPQPLPSNSMGSDGIDISAQPPQQITELPVLPSTNEVHPYAAKPYLRPNITRGGYANWEHYLDVQFRLMREDFVAPLRDGIKTFELKGPANKYSSEVRIYEGVSVCNTVCLLSGVGFQIQFDETKFRRVNWEHSKRLIFGSLLCFSRDNFQTIYFATVVKRDPKLLTDGLVTVQFEDDRLGDIFQIDPEERFVMVESTAYFEAYRHILEGLKRASALHLTDRLQIFKKYLVDCQFDTLVPVPIPRYLRISDKRFRLKEVIDIKAGSPDVIVNDIYTWPPCEHTGLDASQLHAFRAALTQEVSVIQGPPGTGKTYIGLKVVEALVANKEKFQSNNFPILVLCYTNHALDQFLEGISLIKTPGSKELNIIRIGGRCKTKSLEGCVLKAKIDAIRSLRLLPHHIAKNSSVARKEVLSHQETIESVQKSMEALEGRDRVLKLPFLEIYIRPHHLHQLKGEKPTERGREIDVWLKLWYVHVEEEEEELPLEEEDLLPEAYEDITDDHSESDDDYIQVDAEANLLEDQRILEGEELELPRYRSRAKVQQDLFTDNNYDDQQDDSEWSVVQISKDERKSRIKRGQLNKPMSQHEANVVTNIWNLSLKRRWSLYLYWVNELIRDNKRFIAASVLRYNEACKEYTRCRQEIDAYVIQTADIVGMTTTGAAKYNHILSNMLPKIVIIEEAAEVFEAHVFTSLTPSVQQLIMIGDHKQLRPKANCYNLEKNYAFCVSLFERLARNGFPVYTLEVQHRMRPEIASLICPSIYEKLLNNENVERYEHVKGVGSDLFFIDHNRPEKANDDKERSHSNLHEADYLVALCKYLLKQGYRPSEITVLTMYRGQLLELRKRMRKQDYNGVRVAAVDDFQGEENEIILLSLVRSNSNGKIGFLNIENRICVSLSRAKIGFFVIGNLSMLRDKDSTVWPKILADLSQRRCVGKALLLRCQVHPKIEVMASTAEDFLKCPEGGCQQKCDFRLNCGHSCPRLCHPIDQEHEKAKCQHDCPQTLKCGHSCRYKCFECKEGCPPCSQPVVTIIDLCGHEIQMPCHQDPSAFACTKPCTQLLDCGHVCQELCSRLCTTRCRVHVAKILPCGHVRNLPCYLDASVAECRQSCHTTLDCGHKCSGNCGLCQRGRLHVRCQSECGRTLVCSHVCNFPCTPTCPPCMKKCNNYCVHSKCQRKCYEPCVPCREPCKWKCEHLRCHRLCSEMCNRPPCDEPCKKLLKCRHPCIGLCGEKCPTKCRVCDRDEVCEILFGNEEDEDARFIQLEECGHVIEVTACDAWMKQEDDESKPAEVQFKSCPKCKTQIRKSLRYGNIVKQTLQDYENIKRQQLVNLSSDLVHKCGEVQQRVREASSPLLSNLEKKLAGIEKILQLNLPSQIETALPPHQVNNINTQLSYSTHVVTMVKHLSSMESTAGVYESLTVLKVGIYGIKDDIKRLIEFVMQEFLSDQQISDIESEIYRLMSLIRLLDLWCKIRSHGKYSSLSVADRMNLTSQVERVRNSGWKSEIMKEKDHDEIVNYVTKMSAKYDVNGLTDDERIEIVKAIGLTKGHWFKCPKGHYYCIGECGGAMVEAKCPECGATIGGQRHALRSDNQFAPEMDGAQHAAWSEFTNLANFDPNQF